MHPINFFGTIFQPEAKRTAFKKEKRGRVMFQRLSLVCWNTSSLLFLLHPRHCWEASSLLSLAAEEDAGGEDEDGDGVGTECCPGWDRHDVRSTAVTALAAALMSPKLHSHAYDLQKRLWKVHVFMHLGFPVSFFTSVYNQVFSTKKWLIFRFGRKQMFSKSASDQSSGNGDDDSSSPT